MQPVHTRAVALTVTDNNKLVLASPLVPDDRLIHALKVIRALIECQIANELPILSAAFCDSVKKFAKGYDRSWFRSNNLFRLMKEFRKAVAGLVQNRASTTDGIGALVKSQSSHVRVWQRSCGSSFLMYLPPICSTLISVSKRVFHLVLTIMFSCNSRLVACSSATEGSTRSAAQRLFIWPLRHQFCLCWHILWCGASPCVPAVTMSFRTRRSPTYMHGVRCNSRSGALRYSGLSLQ